MYELRPLGFGEILDHSFTLFRRHFSTFLGVAALCSGPAAVVQVYTTLAGGQANNPLLTFLYLLLQFLGGTLQAGATVRLISDIYLDRPVDARQAMAQGFARAGLLFMAGLGASLLVFVGFLLLIVPGFIFAARYSLVYQVVVLEDPPSGMDALPRSGELTLGFKGKVIGLVAVTLCILWIPLGILGAVLGGVVGGIAIALLSVILSPLIYVVLTLVYYDLRVRKEGFDLELLSQQTASTAIS